MGSSPLARGLLTFRDGATYLEGIIPARAGFTARARCSRSPRRDHPRSRGVYGPIAATGNGIFGSSPLARGLRHAIDVPPSRRRIIPARAGFTITNNAGALALADHPRSRGVYSFRLSGMRASTGSSPLARGLQRLSMANAFRKGIIPARAGFTGFVHESAGREQDHPRSRGVYPTDEAPAGSRVRIIPARAGFTREHSGISPWRKDHPRSRGVYDPFRVLSVQYIGSSPLARGLLRRAGVEERRLRIIPARAGFTRSA